MAEDTLTEVHSVTISTFEGTHTGQAYVKYYTGQKGVEKIKVCYSPLLVQIAMKFPDKEETGGMLQYTKVYAGVPFITATEIKPVDNGQY